jgi:hypothetical protein
VSDEQERFYRDANRLLFPFRALRYLIVALGVVVLIIVFAPIWHGYFTLQTAKNRDEVLAFTAKVKPVTVNFAVNAQDSPVEDVCNERHDKWNDLSTPNKDWDWGTTGQWTQGKTAANYRAIQVATKSIMAIQSHVLSVKYGKDVDPCRLTPSDPRVKIPDAPIVVLQILVGVPDMNAGDSDSQTALLDKMGNNEMGLREFGVAAQRGPFITSICLSTGNCSLIENSWFRDIYVDRLPRTTAAQQRVLDVLNNTATQAFWDKAMAANGL